MVEICECCGAVVPGGTEGCQGLFHDILALEYTDPAFGAVHLLTVDAYALQHSENHGPRSNAYHLIRLGWLLEQGGDPRLGQSGPRSRAIAEGYKGFLFLEPPASRGRVTVVDVHSAATPEEHAERVRRWAGSVWEAWSDYHEWACQWLRKE
ncbi:MAG: hypothetical protein KKC18_00385 [Chloroflexi bacterium]|nr:hypothetical protein [Chloroflexota bacterium]